MRVSRNPGVLEQLSIRLLPNRRLRQPSAEVSGHLRHDLRGGARIGAVEFVDIGAKGESHERRYEGPAFHGVELAIGASKIGKIDHGHFSVHWIANGV